MRLPRGKDVLRGTATLPLEANEPIKVKSSNLFIKPRRYVMKEERIIIIDEGIDEVTPEARMCCAGPYFAFRG